MNKFSNRNAFRGLKKSGGKLEVVEWVLSFSFAR